LIGGLQMPSPGEALKSAAEQQPQLPVWITHMWQRRIEHSRLGLVLGAGVSDDADIPMWGELVTRLMASANFPDDRMAAHKNDGLTPTLLAEMAYRRHFDSQTEAHSDMVAKFRRYQVDASWCLKIHACLYEKVMGKTFAEIAEKHVYLEPLAELICKSQFAVTFNFDDIVDEAVITYADKGRGQNPEIIVRPKIETRKDAPIIYHINGKLPREELRGRSEQVLLTEDAFADILLSPNSHDAEFVINKFAVRTFLLLGVSLTDNSLKNLLRSAAKRNPSNHHFIVYFEDDDRPPRSKEVRQDLFDANLHVYNLISIFLSRSEIKALIQMLNLDIRDAEFENQLRHIAKVKIDRKYYLVGSVAAGKSSTLEALRCFTTHEEWKGRVPAEMYLKDETLDEEQQRKVDQFLYPQLTQKNRRMSSEYPALRVMDRAYLDLFAFSKSSEEIKRKAIRLKEEVDCWGGHFQDGQIFFLTASVEEFKERLAKRALPTGDGKKIQYDPESLIAQDAKLRKIYKPEPKSTFDTSEMVGAETAKKIARAILLGPYEAFDFAARLAQICKDGDL
jgi:SIR2-like protein